MIVDHAEELLVQSEEQALVFGLAVHANIIGQPFRLRHFRRALEHLAGRRDRIWITRAADVAEHIHERPDLAV